MSVRIAQSVSEPGWCVVLPAVWETARPAVTATHGVRMSERSALGGRVSPSEHSGPLASEQLMRSIMESGQIISEALAEHHARGGFADDELTWSAREIVISPRENPGCGETQR